MFDLLGEKTYYKEVVTKLPPYWDKGVLIEQPPTISYVTFLGWDEPFGNDSEESVILPSGVESSSSRWLFTTEKLKVHESFETSTGIADKIYLRNPETGRSKPQAYVIAKAEDWDVTDNFTLLEPSLDYVITREDKLK